MEGKTERKVYCFFLYLTKTAAIAMAAIIEARARCRSDKRILGQETPHGASAYRKRSSLL